MAYSDADHHISKISFIGCSPSCYKIIFTSSINHALLTLMSICCIYLAYLSYVRAFSVSNLDAKRCLDMLIFRWQTDYLVGICGRMHSLMLFSVHITRILLKRESSIFGQSIARSYVSVREITFLLATTVLSTLCAQILWT